MRVTQELYNRLQVGDLVLIKTPGQLIDSGWSSFKTHYSLWVNGNELHLITTDMALLLGQMLFIKEIENGRLFFEGCKEGFTIEAMQELYPLMRGIYE